MSTLHPYIIGITGGSASGKTSFLHKLVSSLPKGAVSVVSQDNYYLPLEKQYIDENGVPHFDLPESIDRNRFHNDLVKLHKGQPIELLEYTFNNPGKEPDKIIIEPAPIIIMEGLFIFYYEEVRDQLDLKVYIDAKEDVKLDRRMRRDKLERGIDESTILYQWEKHVMPSYKAYLQPLKFLADVVVQNNVSYDLGLQMLRDHLECHLERIGFPFTENR